jgi:hypothetical protein
VRHAAPRRRTVAASTRGAKRATVLVPEEIALVEAIRRAYGSAEGYRGLEAFHVGNIFDFARRLHGEGVRAQQVAPA